MFPAEINYFKQKEYFFFKKKKGKMGGNQTNWGRSMV